MTNKIKQERYFKSIYLPLKEKAREAHKKIKKNSEISEALIYLEERGLVLDLCRHESERHAERLLDNEIEE